MFTFLATGSIFEQLASVVSAIVQAEQIPKNVRTALCDRRPEVLAKIEMRLALSSLQSESGAGLVFRRAITLVLLGLPRRVRRSCV